MKRIVMMLVALAMMLGVSHASDVSLKEMKDFITNDGKVKILDVKAFAPDENLTLNLTEEELFEMEEEKFSRIECNMHYLSFRIKIKELLNKGNIKIWVDYEDGLYNLNIYSSRWGHLKSFNSNLEITIPYDIDEESYYITMYGINENEEIVNLRGTMDEETHTVFVLIDEIDMPIIPVVNKIIYNDLEDFTWAKEFIERAAAKGILSGKSDGVYQPEQYITRAEFVTLLLKVLDLDIIETANNFYDVNKNEWYYDYVVTADYYGLTSGVNDYMFQPDEPITRQDITVMVGKALNEFDSIDIEEKEYDFSDMNEITDYAVPYLEKCLDTGLISGYGDGSFRPNAYASRAEAAVIIDKLFSKINVF